MATNEETWGLKMTKVVAPNAIYSGRGIKVAILDTGLDLTHPDFRNRSITSLSFLTDIYPDQTAQDDHGHGTHCAGIACGSLNPSSGRRYGVAYNAELFIGKIADSTGQVYPDAMKRGIKWAIDNKCHVVSMSLGAPGSDFDFYQEKAKEAMDAGVLLIAAAGNDSNRAANIYNPICSPADSPLVMAVASVDSQLKIANSSNRGTTAHTNDGGSVDTGIDIAAPGVQIYSSWLMPERTRTVSGTSQAAAYVTGVAALWAEATGARGSSLWLHVINNARSLNYPAMDVGKGLLTAPPI